MTICTVDPRDVEELERLNRALVAAPSSKDGEARYRAQIGLLTFIEEHPTVIPVLAQAWRIAKKEEAHAS
jgi:hypothetical protein